MKKGQTSKAWSDADHRRLCALAKEGKSWDEIAAEFPGRTASACFTRYRRGYEPRGPSQRRASMDNAFQARQAVAELPPRSLTAEFFGDPLPGRSALDRRSAQPEVRTISLAGMLR